jgi:hypothetical protein
MERKGGSAMAKPIEPTPILKGKDAQRLLRSVASPVRSEKKALFLARCDATYKKLSVK